MLDHHLLEYRYFAFTYHRKKNGVGGVGEAGMAEVARFSGFYLHLNKSFILENILQWFSF